MAGSDVGKGLLGRGLPFVRLGSGPPLVYLAGLTAHHEVPSGADLRFTLWQLRPYAARRQVWWLNRRRGVPVGASMADLAADVADALRSTFAGPVDVLGVSTGGSVALQLAADHPGTVGRLVLVAAAYRLGSQGRLAQQRLAHHVRAGHPRAGSAALMATAGATRWSRLLLGGLGWAMQPWVLATSDPGDLLATVEAEDQFDLRDRLGRVRPPTLLVGGTRDVFYDDGRLFVETARLLPQARLVLYPGKGHLGTVSSRRLPRDVMAFLDSTTS